MSKLCKRKDFKDRKGLGVRALRLSSASARMGGMGGTGKRGRGAGMSVKP